MVIELQHSFLRVQEREARESFYGKMAWVVEGRRRKRDAMQFSNCIGPRVWSRPPFILHVALHEECALLRDWKSSQVPVYFDLGTSEEGGGVAFWRLDPISGMGRAYLTPVLRELFLKVHLEGLDSERMFSEAVGVIVGTLQPAAYQPPSLSRVDWYIPKGRSGRRRF